MEKESKTGKYHRTFLLRLSDSQFSEIEASAARSNRTVSGQIREIIDIFYGFKLWDDQKRRES